MFKLITFCLLFVFLPIVLCDEETEETEEEEANEIESLCDRPMINAADRMLNNTVRLYRGRYYWTLNGLPSADSGTLDGPYVLPFEKMGSIFRNDTVVTLLGGTDRGKTVKMEGKNYWMWDAMGNMKTEISGLTHNRFPTGGFEAAIHDGNLDDPTLIGFKGIKTYYFSTRYRLWTVDKASGYYGGKYNEAFPTDLSAAFTLPADNPEDEYIAYFFKRDKYCKRSKILKSGKECDEWKPNKLLFGCDQPTDQRIHSQQNSDSQSEDEEPEERVKETTVKPPSEQQTVTQKTTKIQNSIETTEAKPGEGNPTQNDPIQTTIRPNPAPGSGMSFQSGVSLATTIFLVFIQFILEIK